MNASSVEKQAMRIATELKEVLCARLLDTCSEMEFRRKRRMLLNEFRSLPRFTPGGEERNHVA